MMLERIASHVRGNVVGYLALFVALTGTAVASGVLNKKKVNKIITNRAPGLSVAQAKSADSAKDADRLGGRVPDAYGSVLMGSTTDPGMPSISSLAAINLAPSGASAPSANGPFQLSPAVPVVFRDLTVELTSALPADVQLKFTLAFDDAAAPVTCTIPSAGTTCTDGTDSETVSPGTRVTLNVHNTGSSSSPIGLEARWGFRATAP